VVEQVTPPGRRTVLVGHTFGAELARRAGAQLGDRLQAIVYVDYLDPALRTDPDADADIDRDQREDEAYRKIIRSLNAGLGSLMDVPTALAGLPPRELKQAMTQFRDSRLWRSAHREFLGAVAEGDVEYGELSGVDGLIISSGEDHQQPRQHESDSAVAEWHRRSGGRRAIERIKNFGQGPLLTDHRSATVVADRIIGFLCVGRARATLPGVDREILQEQ
jgi:pimeloyl-ACP methyl ester carboxylesterase